LFYRVRADAAQRPCGQLRGGRERGEGEGGRCVRADALVSVRTRFLLRLRVKPRRRVNADAGGRPEDVRERLDEKDVRTDIFIQKRPL
jgi:hypothetical protein